MPFDRSKYPPDWDDITKRIRTREGDCCKWCGVANGRRIVRSVDMTIFMTHEGRLYDANNGELLGNTDTNPLKTMPDLRDDSIRIVLTVAHLDHDPRNNDDVNLAALCQMHHLALDRKQHNENRRRNLHASKAHRDMFQGDVPPHVTVEQDLDKIEDEANRILADDPTNQRGLDLKATVQRVRQALQ